MHQLQQWEISRSQGGRESVQSGSFVGLPATQGPSSYGQLLYRVRT